MRVDEQWMQRIFSVLKSKPQRKILFLLEKDRAYSYTEMLKLYNAKSSNVFAFHLRSLVNAGVLKQENKMYFLTRIGLETVNLIEEYKKICMAFDLTDCDADGRVQLMVIRN